MRIGVGTASAGVVALLLGALEASGQVTIDVRNRHPNVGALMVWRVDEANRPTRLVGFSSGTLIRDRVMVTAGHVTAPMQAVAGLPVRARMFASFSPTAARDPGTWIPVIRQATHPSMPPCPPPPQCDPTDEILVAPLEPGIADVGLVLLEHAPRGIQPARLADHGRLARSEGWETTIVGYGTAAPVAKGDTSTWDGRRRVRTSKLRKVVDETWALWSIPSYVCFGDSGGAIFINVRHEGKGKETLVANVSDGGRDCRRHNNHNRLDTPSVQQWILDTLKHFDGVGGTP